MILAVIFTDILWTILGALVFCIVLGLIVLVHEGGHFLFAKKAGILCHEFSIGMGPVIFQKKKGETYYSIRAIPLGGFVSMAGEEVEFDLLKGVNKVKLVFDNKRRVSKIIFNLNNPLYNDYPVYNVLEHDLIGTKEAKKDELFIKVQKENNENEEQNEAEETFIVNRDTIINYQKKAELQIAPYDRNFVNKPLKNRFASVVAGPLMNFIFAVVLFFILGLFQGYPNTNATKLDEVTNLSPAYEIGLEENDVITKINGDTVTKWDDISKIMSTFASGKQTNGNPFPGYFSITYRKAGSTDEITKTVYPYVFVYTIEMALQNNEDNLSAPIVGTYSTEDVNKQTKSYKGGLRDGDKITKINDTVISSKNDVLAFFSSGKLNDAKKVTIEYIRDDKTDKVDIDINSDSMLASQGITPTKVQIGISPKYGFNLGKLIYMPWVDTGTSCLTIFKTLGLLFTDSTVNVDDLSGPIGIFELLKEQTKQGILNVIYWTATLSVNIGLVNLLPLPALDGGRLAFLGYEAVTRKKPNAKVENIIHTIGFILLMGLFVFISFNDLVRCVSKLF